MHWLPTWPTTIIAFAPDFFNFEDSSNIIALYCSNLYFGKRPFSNPAVVDGVYKVANPIAPIFIPLDKVYIWLDACLGKKLIAPV